MQVSKWLGHSSTSTLTYLRRLHPRAGRRRGEQPARTTRARTPRGGDREGRAAATAPDEIVQRPGFTPTQRSRSNRRQVWRGPRLAFLCLPQMARNLPRAAANQPMLGLWESLELRRSDRFWAKLPLPEPEFAAPLNRARFPIEYTGSSNESPAALWGTMCSMVQPELSCGDGRLPRRLAVVINVYRMRLLAPHARCAAVSVNCGA